MKNIVFIIVIICLMSCSSPVITKPPNQPPTTHVMVIVDVRGEVYFPGLYEVHEGIMLYEVIELAGGFTSQAFIDDLPLVSQITSSQMIIINSYHQDSIPKNNKVNLNIASLQDLMTLPGIGQVKAEAIINYRKKQGRFQTLEDIMKVPGIGNATYILLKEFITV